LREERHPRGTLYQVGDLVGVYGTWEIAIVEVGAGNVRAAMEAERAIAHFSPHIALFVGIAGGLKDVGLGDVVASTKIYNYASGKDRRTFEPRPDLGESAYELVQRARAEAREDDWVARVVGRKPARTPRAFVAPIAAGEVVIADRQAATARLLRQMYGDAVAVEMEGRGLLQAAQANSPVLAMVVRGISDLLSGKASADAAGSQQQAAAHAAAFAMQLLAKLPPREVDGVLSADLVPQASASAPPPVPIGAISGPESKPEDLISNLLEVISYAPRVYLADTAMTRRPQVWQAFSAVDERCPAEFLLTEGRILSFHDLREYPWTRVCDRGTVEDFDTSEWANSDDSVRQAQFVELLMGALAERLGPAVRQFREREVFAFAATGDLQQKAVRYQSGLRTPRRTVFQEYRTVSGGKEYVHYRHTAFRARFQRFAGAWYLEVTPTYLFTWDGKKLHRLNQRYLRGIKRLDRNRAVRAQLLLWGDYLRGDITHTEYRLLSFGEFLEAPIDVGIDDRQWQMRDDLAPAEEDADEQKVSATQSRPRPSRPTRTRRGRR
jgi:nucleoside phosphorylase